MWPPWGASGTGVDVGTVNTSLPLADREEEEFRHSSDPLPRLTALREKWHQEEEGLRLVCGEVSWVGGLKRGWGNMIREPPRGDTCCAHGTSHIEHYRQSVSPSVCQAGPDLELARGSGCLAGRRKYPPATLWGWRGGGKEKMEGGLEFPGPHSQVTEPALACPFSPLAQAASASGTS